MKQTLAKQIEELRDMTVAELRDRYWDVFAEPTTSRHKDFIRKRIAWRLQERESGGLSERALCRAKELANEADLRLLAPKKDGGSLLPMGRTVIGRVPTSPDRRLPMPGCVLTREYRGRTISVTALNEGFEFEGKVYRSLTAVAQVITGTHWNGLLFFGIAKGGTQ